MTHQLPAVDRAIRDLDQAAVLVVALAELRDPTARRPWREPALTHEQRAELDYAARMEQAERTEEAPGAHLDAARADVLDALAEVLDRAENLAAHMSRAGHDPAPVPQAAADGDPRPYLDRAAWCLPAAIVMWSNGAEIAHYAADEAAGILAVLGHALALAYDGQALTASCPWCHGGLAGDRTLRVRVLPGGEPGVVCESGVCQPPRRDVGTWWGGCPVWPFAQWEWLARRLAHLDRRRPAEPPTVVTARAEGATGRAGTHVDVSALRELLAGLVRDPDEAAWPEDHPRSA